MGKILSSKQITQNNIETFLTNATKDYSSFLNSSPTFITYYSKDEFSSTYDKGFENYNQSVGSESPLKFNKVENIPIYKIESSDFGTSITDFGIEGNVTSSALMLPDTIKPNVDDHFFIFYSNIQKIFVVTDVNQDNYNNKKFYRIAFKLSPHNLDQIEQQKAKDLVVDYELLGKTESPIYDKVNYTLYKDIEVIYNQLLDFYKERFYNPYTYLFTGKIKGISVVDYALNKFIRENFINNKLNDEYRSFTYVDVDKYMYSRSYVEDTVYGNLLKTKNLDHLKLSNVTAVYNGRPGRNTQQWLKNNNPLEAKWIHKDVITLPTDISLEVYKKLIDNTSTTDPYINFIKDYVNDVHTKSRYVNLIDSINTIEDYEESYFTLPICLHILNLYYSDLVTKKFI